MFAIRKISTGEWFCYCSTTGEPLLRSGDPLKVGAELFISEERAEFEIKNGVHPFWTLKRKNFELVEV